MMNSTITLAPSPVSNLPTYTGFIFLLGSSFLYGSNYIPVKQYETGDGMYFQLILCTAIWSVGLIVYLSRNLPTFYALPMLGGFLWATGNVNTVIIIRTIGIGLGLLFWSLVGLVTGWGTARYGWFGVKKQVPSNVVLNYVGVFLTIVSTIVYLFVKSESTQQTHTSSDVVLPIDDSTTTTTDNVSQISINHSHVNLASDDEQRKAQQPQQAAQNQQQQRSNSDFLDRFNPKVKRIIGVVLSFISGILYGESNTPVLIARDIYQTSSNYLDYLFSFYTGILATSVAYFIIYTFVKKFKPDIYPQVTLPAFVSGWMWGGANLCYFMATNALTQSISYPISAAGPTIFATLWGTFLFKEIRGLRNFIFLILGYVLAITGSVLVGLSF